MSLLLNKILEKIHISKQKGSNLIIGIDGPTAAGKTTLADKLAKKINSKNIFIFRLDWTLKSRNHRENSLKYFKSNEANFFYEPEDHMDLDKTVKFLDKIEKFNFGKKKKLNIYLKNLYNRSGSAKNDLNIKQTIDRNTIIIIEGHYTAYTNISNKINFNILLLANKKELLKRKINRVKSYRNPSVTKEYFDLIDVPSFVNYLSRFGNNYDLIVDNSNFNKAKIKKINFISKWTRNVFKNKRNTNNLGFIFSSLNFFKSFKNDLFNKKLNTNLLNLLINLDNYINNNFTVSIESINTDLYNYISLLVKQFNTQNKNKTINFNYTNNFHNLYRKKLPIIIGLTLSSEKNKVYILVHINSNNLKIIFHWIGGSEEIEIKRNIGQEKININSNTSIIKSNIEKFQISENNELYCYIPTDYTFINIFKNLFSNKIILINQEDFVVNAAEIKDKFYSQNVFWIHRFAKFSERNFFKNILIFLGAEVFCINNYLFCFKSNNVSASKLFRNFFKKWEVEDNSDSQIIDKSNIEYDSLIDNERNFLKDFVKNKTKNFKCLDGKIYFISKNKFNSKKQIYNDILALLNNKHRIVRKSAINYIKENIPLENLNSKLLWKECDINTNITLEQFINISPTILNDLYFWINIKNQNQSILAANVYDIRPGSHDIKAYLETSQKYSKPLVIQSSFNALGQKEKYKNKFSEGYLKLKKGPSEFVDNTFNSAVNLFLKNKKDFLFGIGLDHIDFRYDFPKNRIYRFLNSFKKKNLITHFTLDSSFLLEDPKIKNFDKNKKKLILKVLKKEFELLNNIKNNHIYDFEFCANELNYVENKKKVYVPSIIDIKYFAKEFFNIINKSNIKYFNSRPKLIIGNLGTVHHGYDKNNFVKTEISKEWVDSIKKYNFISAVLHGTSRSHPDVLKKATAGCYKINVAGDFLQIFVSNLPSQLKEVVKDVNDNDKKKLYLIRDKLKHINILEKNKIHNALVNKCESLMNLIQTPELTINDINYFKYKSYDLDTNQSSYIAKLVSNSKISSEVKYFKGVKNSKFLFSPIEVNYGLKFKKLVKIFLKKKLDHFHLDVGDGELISRVLNVSEKLKYIKKISNKNKIHLHLMVANLDQEEKANKYIKHYANLGADYIGLHSRSFSNYKNLEKGICKILSLKKKPGIFLEVNEEINDEISNLILKYKIDWIVFMGVPLGYGGQLFHYSIISNILKTQSFFKKKNFKINYEIDGGLTLDVIKSLKKYDIKYYSGWSVVNGRSIKEISRKLGKVLSIIK